MYESPIELIYKETFPTMIKQQEDLIMRGCLDIGVHIDKEELIKALQYDREQYQKGYKDGKPKKGEWKRTMTYYPYCSCCNWCPEEEEMTNGCYNFCPNCGADMRGEENERTD